LKEVKKGMIEFLKTKRIKAFHEIIAIAEKPDLLFSNDREQYNAEALYNLYTLQKLNKLIRKGHISMNELAQVFNFIETSWSVYLSKHYKNTGKDFVFYCWGDYQIPAIRFSIVSYYEGLELPFTCVLNKVNDMKDVLSEYITKAQLEGISIMEEQTPHEVTNLEPGKPYTLTLYSKKIHC
jgi:hypothetical protein